MPVSLVEVAAVKLSQNGGAQQGGVVLSSTILLCNVEILICIRRMILLSEKYNILFL